MSKIPKNLSDKDMFKDYQEDTSIESAFMAAEAADAKRKRSSQKPEPDIKIAYLTPDIVEKLGKLLLELKLNLYQEGEKGFKMRVKREGRQIILEPDLPKKK